MMIQGIRELYKVNVGHKGFSGVFPIVYAKRKIPFLPLSRWVRVWDGPNKISGDEKKMYPAQMKSWFNRSVEDYEKYKAAWDRKS
jgi:hypothetical protein